MQTPAENISTWPHMSPAPSHLPISRSPTSNDQPPAKRSASTFIPQRRRPVPLNTIPTIPRHFTAPEIPQIKSEHPPIPFVPSASHRPPIGLSLSDDDPPTHISLSSDSASPEAQHTQNQAASPSKRITPETKAGEHRPSVTSPMETIDQLYEYFPLSLDDWMPPVDAIYRPHVVHHLKVVNAGATPQEGKVAGQFASGTRRGKPKRYFSGGDD